MTLSACRAPTDTIALSTLCSFTRTTAASSSGGTTLLPNGSSAQAPRSSAAAMIPPRRSSLMSGVARHIRAVGVPAVATVLEGDHVVAVHLPGVEAGVAVARHVRCKCRDRRVIGVAAVVVAAVRELAPHLVAVFHCRVVDPRQVDR